MQFQRVKCIDEIKKFEEEKLKKMIGSTSNMNDLDEEARADRAIKQLEQVCTYARDFWWENIRYNSNSLKRRLNTIENHMGGTEAAPYSSRKCEREDVEPPLKPCMVCLKKSVNWLKIFDMLLHTAAYHRKLSEYHARSCTGKSSHYRQ